nr:F-box only protein 6 isoform X2 [Symphalangus syndactylus]
MPRELAGRMGAEKASTRRRAGRLGTPIGQSPSGFWPDTKGSPAGCCGGFPWGCFITYDFQAKAMDAPHPKAALDSINELPENILLELFTHVPARQLLLNCRLVCSLWRDLIDLMTLWKRKCLREGFITEDWDQPVADWKIFYFLRSLHRNLLRNPCAEGSWEIGRARWLTPVIPALWEAETGDYLRSGVQDQPGQHGETPSLQKYKKISQAGWQAPVISAPLQAEAGESLEPRRWRLQ